MNLINFDLSDCENVGFLFYQCKSLTSIDFPNLDDFLPTNIANMFYGCS